MLNACSLLVSGWSSLWFSFDFPKSCRICLYCTDITLSIWHLQQVDLLLQFHQSQLMMISKIIFRFAFPRPSLQNKIKTNHYIQTLRSQKEMIDFYHANHVNLNLINLVSYARKYTDFLISSHQKEIAEDLEHTTKIMQQIKKMIVEEKYKLFGDREHDHKRAFIMILSLSVEMIAQSRNVETFQETAQLAVKMLEKTNYLRICNPHELSVFLRCVTQVEKLHLSKEQERQCWNIAKEKLNNISSTITVKFLHSFSKFKTFDQVIIKSLLSNISKAQDLNDKDRISLFSASNELYEKEPSLFDLLSPILQSQQKAMSLERPKLNVRWVGAIFQGLTIPDLPIHPQFLEYMVEEFLQLNQLTILCLAHIFNFYQKANLKATPLVLKKSIEFIEKIELASEYDTEVFLMFFQDFTTYANPELLQTIYKKLQSAIFNDFSIGKLFATLLKIQQNDYQVQDFCELACQKLSGHVGPLNVHALNSILRARYILNGTYTQQINEIVENIWNRHSDEMINKYFEYLVTNGKDHDILEFLQVLVDTMKVLQDLPPLKQVVQRNIKQLLSQIQSADLEKLAHRHITILQQYI